LPRRRSGNGFRPIDRDRRYLTNAPAVFCSGSKCRRLPSFRSAAVTWLQQWTASLFLHFAVRPDELAPLVPPRLEIDTLSGQAWLSFVIFRLKLRPAGLPLLPVLSSLVEMNVRTYVRHRGHPGVY